MKINLTNSERRMLLKVLSAPTNTHDQRARISRLVTSLNLAELSGVTADGDDDTGRDFEIDSSTRKAGEEICKTVQMQGDPFLQMVVYGLGEKFTTLKPV